MKALHQRDTEQDHRASHDQRSDNSPNQNATLCKRRNAKMRENQHKHKNIVHAQRILDEIGGEKIEAVMWSLDTPDQGIKCQRHEQPDHGPLKPGTHAQFATATLGGEEEHARSEEHTSELQSRFDLVCRLLLEKKKPSTSTCGMAS